MSRKIHQTSNLLFCFQESLIEKPFLGLRRGKKKEENSFTYLRVHNLIRIVNSRNLWRIC